METSKKANTNPGNGSGNGIILYKRRWVILGIFSLISMTNEVIWISLSSVSSILHNYYRVSYMAITWLAMVFPLLNLATLLSLNVLNLFGLKVTIVGGAVCNTVASALRLIGYRRNGYIFALLGNIFGGLGQSFIMFIPPTLAQTWFGESERGKASAIGVLMNTFGVAVGFIMGSLFVPNSKDYDVSVSRGLFKTLLVQLLFCILLLLLAIAFIRKAPDTPPTQTQALRIRRKQAKKAVRKQEKVMKTLGQVGDVAELKITQSYANPTYERESSVISAEFYDPDELEGCDKDGRKSTNSEEMHNKKKDEKEEDFEEENQASDDDFEEQTREVDVKENEDQKTFDKIDDILAKDIEQLKTTPSTGLTKNFKIVVHKPIFHYLTQAYSLYFGLFSSINSLLNQMTTSQFPGREKLIGMMGFTSIIIGVCAILLSGIFLDKTHRYKLISCSIFTSGAICFLAFTLALKYSGNIVLVFILFSAHGFFMYPYLSVGLEYMAESLYPIKESGLSVVLVMVSGIHGVVLTNITGILLKRFGVDIAGYFMAALYVVGLVLVALGKEELKRHEVDKAAKQSNDEK